MIPLPQLDAASDEPIYRQLYLYIRQQIQDGKIGNLRLIRGKIQFCSQRRSGRYLPCFDQRQSGRQFFRQTLAKLFGINRFSHFYIDIFGFAGNPHSQRWSKRQSHVRIEANAICHRQLGAPQRPLYRAAEIEVPDIFYCFAFYRL